MKKHKTSLWKSETAKILAKVLCFLFIVAPTVIVAAHAQTDTAAFKEIFTPILRLIDLLKYASTILALLYFIIAGLNFVVSGGNVGNKEKSKQMITGIIIGLGVIWAASAILNYVFT